MRFKKQKLQHIRAYGVSLDKRAYLQEQWITLAKFLFSSTIILLLLVKALLSPRKEYT